MSSIRAVLVHADDKPFPSEVFEGARFHIVKPGDEFQILVTND